MKVIEHLNNAVNPLISFELIPPKRGGDIRGLLSVLDDISKFNPPFIDITSHAAEVFYEETPTGIKKKVKRKRPGTLGICALIQNKYNIDAVPHVISKGFTREETEDFLIELNYLQIQNVLAIRGDDSGYEKPIPEGKSKNPYAVDLVKQIINMNNGKYLEDSLLDALPTDFCIGVGGYPEKHFEAPNLKTDIKYVKEKVDAGAEYIVTQMFYDNRHYFNYVDQCREIGIDVPIIPGLKVLTSKAHLTSVPKNFFLNIPDELSDEIMAARPEQVLDIGVEWAAKQVEELLNANVKSIHFYVMQNSKPILKLMERLKL
ncbi:MAG: methylenetetrahydrofolate reductase [NAD(P)H] [Ignavibacteriota bacterium]|jgi:methylenetetrahydrofolate reductase (NADPH)|nr:methylenetetrahydrofolate reductase [NAD(P)H] [Ignavibacteriota bacterium]MBW7842263.1 methylenetetrahydrofolate reductase [Ignavibacterium sp.]MCO6448078.1 methylenetetrahydrofolate reductase [Ignavibacterium album]MCZ2268814.1 methylenetetrahydrofolate reductase [Ignavibacteriales bacterium]MDX9712356.1 methylenetetrahydrofolate reductase [Ignavibacteriaceae bacterium]